MLMNARVIRVTMGQYVSMVSINLLVTVLQDGREPYAMEVSRHNHD